MNAFVVAVGMTVVLTGSVPREMAGPTQGTADTAYAFVNVNVIPMDVERILPGQTVLVQDGRIVDMGQTGDVEVPADASRIDGSGKYLMPGLAEMHGHTPGGVSSEFTENVMFLYVANGITTVRGMLGRPGDLELRARANSGQIVAPTLYWAGPSFNDNSISSPTQAAQRVREQKAQGWDLLKIHPGLTREEYDAMARTASEVGIRFGGHVPSDVGLEHALARGQETFDHLDGFIEYLDAFDKQIDPARLAHIVQRTKEAGAWVVPTMVLWEVGVIGLGNTDELAGLPEMRYWPDDRIQGWVERHRRVQSAPDFDVELGRIHAENRKRVLKALSDGGVGVLMGTDSPQMFSVPGFSLHREMRAMAEAGMTPYQILESGTKNVGEYFRRHDAFGTVAVGRRADLLLVNANPLFNVANVAKRTGVMVRGRWFPEAEIQGRLERLAASLGH